MVLCNRLTLEPRVDFDVFIVKFIAFIMRIFVLLTQTGFLKLIILRVILLTVVVFVMHIFVHISYTEFFEFIILRVFVLTVAVFHVVHLHDA